MSARELQVRDINKQHPLFRRKSLPTFTLIRPWVVTNDELGATPALQMMVQIKVDTRVSADRTV